MPKILLSFACASLLTGGSTLHAQALPTPLSKAEESLTNLLAEFPGPPNKRFHWRKSGLKSKYDKYTDSTTVWTRVEYYGGTESKNFGFTVVDKGSVDIIPMVRFAGTQTSTVPPFVTLFFSATQKQSAKAAIKETVQASQKIRIPLIVDSARISYDAELVDSDLDFFGSDGKSRLTYAAVLPLAEFLKLARATKVEGRVNDTEFSLERKHDYTIALADIFSKLQASPTK